MPLASVKGILRHAMENNYGVAAVNVLNYETIKWTIAAAVQENAPVIIQFYPGLSTYIPSPYIAHMAKDMARNAPVPVGVHLDHSVNLAIAVSGIRDGYPSVMVDGSSLPFEENQALTTAVVQTARVFGVDVEAELGHVGSGADVVDRAGFTDPDHAARFAAATGCDALAVAVGSAHGVYRETPSLDLARIRAIRDKTTIPLVLHGCSGIPDEQLQAAVQAGMSKFNIATDYFQACYGALKQPICENGDGPGDFIRLYRQAEAPAVAFIRQKIRVLKA